LFSRENGCAWRALNTLGFSSVGEREGRRCEEREGMIGLKLDRSLQTTNLEERNPRRHRRGEPG
jgi:hypothetical protein